MRGLLILISEELRAALESDQGGRLARALGRVNRADYRILAIAPRPERWRPTRRSMDNELFHQQALYEKLNKTGASFDGVYYYPTSWFTQQRLRQDMYDTLARRADVPLQNLVMMTAYPKEQDGARDAGLRVIPLAIDQPDEPDDRALEMWLEALDVLITDELPDRN